MPDKITKRTLDAALARKADTTIRDRDIAGFHAKVGAHGRAGFHLYYRTSSGTERRPKIGDYPAMAPEAARQIAKDWLARVRLGEDPSGKRRAARSAITITDLCDKYLTEHVEPHKKQSSIDSDKQLIKACIRPSLGRIKVPDLTRADVEKFKLDRTATKISANRSLALLSHMMTMAVVWGLRPDNPVKGIKRFPEVRRDRYYSADELRRIHETLTECERNKTVRSGVILAIRLLALTGCRLGEIIRLRWSDVDFARRAFLIRDAKAGARVQTVGAPVLALLKDLQPKNDGWVVEGMKPDKPLDKFALEHNWKRIRALAGLTNARLHDFRHTVATTAANGGANAFMLRDLLGHKTLAMTARYVSSVPEQQRSVADKVAEAVSAAMTRPPAEIVQLPPKVA